MGKSGYLVGGEGWGCGRERKWGLGGLSLGNIKRKQFSPQFGEKTGDKSGEGVLMMGNYAFALPLCIYLFFIFFFLFCLVCYCATLVGWCCFASFLFIYIYIYIKRKLFYFILLFFLLLDILLVLLGCSN